VTAPLALVAGSAKLPQHAAKLAIEETQCLSTCGDICHAR
jgi:hypothetical protein